MSFPVQTVPINVLSADGAEFTATAIDGLIAGTLPDGTINPTEFLTAWQEGLFDGREDLANAVVVRFLGLDEAQGVSQEVPKFSLVADSEGRLVAASYGSDGMRQEFSFFYDAVGRLATVQWRKGAEHLLGTVDYGYPGMEGPFLMAFFETGPEGEHTALLQEVYGDGQEVPEFAKLTAQIRGQHSSGSQGDLERLHKLLTSPLRAHLRSGLKELAERIDRKDPVLFKEMQALPDTLGRILASLVSLDETDLQGLAPEEKEKFEGLAYALVETLPVPTVAKALLSIPQSTFAAACLGRVFINDPSKYSEIVAALELFDSSCQRTGPGGGPCETSTNMPKAREIRWMAEGIRFVRGRGFVPSQEMKAYLPFYLSVTRALFRKAAWLDPKASLTLDFTPLEGAHSGFHVSAVPEYTRSGGRDFLIDQRFEIEWPDKGD